MNVPIVIAVVIGFGCLYSSLEEWSERSYGFAAFSAICATLSAVAVVILWQH